MLSARPCARLWEDELRQRAARNAAAASVFIVVQETHKPDCRAVKPQHGDPQLLVRAEPLSVDETGSVCVCVPGDPHLSSSTLCASINHVYMLGMGTQWRCKLTKCAAYKAQS